MAAERTEPKREAAPKPAKKPRRDESYEDTQPELPAIRQPAEEPVRVEAAKLEARPTAESEKTRPKAAAPKPAEKAAEKPAEKPATTGGNGDQHAAAGASKAPKSEAGDKPQGRLLPWEPQAPSEKPAAEADKD